MQVLYIWKLWIKQMTFAAVYMCKYVGNMKSALRREEEEASEYMRGRRVVVVRFRGGLPFWGGLTSFLGMVLPSLGTGTEG